MLTVTRNMGVYSAIVLLFCLIPLCYGQENAPVPTSAIPTSLHVGLTEKIGNFSVELLYYSSIMKQSPNMIMSPLTVWTVLAVISEGASGNTLRQINSALRLKSRYRDETRSNFRNIAQWLTVKTNTIELAKFNGMFVDEISLPKKDFEEAASIFYETIMIPLNFSNPQFSADRINGIISNITHGRIPKTVEKSYFENGKMLLSSALYFRGQWTVPFNATSTVEQQFYDSTGKSIGKVNMMYNKYAYPFAYISELKARVIELPYGKENRLSMLIMLPNPKVSLEDMFLKFNNITLDKVFNDLRVSQEEYGEDEIDCFVPRFKITSDMDLTDILKESFNITDLFDEHKARLPSVARTPVYVTKVVHKAEIEVTEEGTTAAAVTVAEFANRIGNVRFEANRPFTFMIVEKITNSIVFGGFYQQPSLY